MFIQQQFYYGLQFIFENNDVFQSILIRHFGLILTFSIQLYIIFLQLSSMQTTKESLYEGMQNMEEKHIDQIKDIMTQSYLHKNQVWSAFNLDREVLKAFFENLVKTHLKMEKETSQKLGKDLKLNTIFSREGKILAFILHYDSQDYKKLHESEGESEIQLFRALQKAANKLTKGVNFDYQPGEAAYVNFGGVPSDDSMPTKEKIWILHLFIRRLRDAGYRKVIGRATNARAVALYKKLGATNIREHFFEKDGKPITLFWFEIDLYCEAFYKIMGMNPVKPVPKL